MEITFFEVRGVAQSGSVSRWIGRVDHVNHCTYIIESETSGKWYYGHTADMEERLIRHNTGRNKSTKGKGPWRLIFKRDFETKLEANRFELKLKSLRNKEYIKREYGNYFL